MNQIKVIFIGLCTVLGAIQVVEAQQKPALSIVRATPYLQNPTDGGITVCWQTNSPCYSYVEWGLDTVSTLNRARTMLAGQVIANNTLNKIRLNGIEPGEKYYYRIISQEITHYGPYSKKFGEKYVSPFYGFEIPSINESNFDALIFNDLHQQTATFDLLMPHIKDIKYDIAFFNGDCVDDPASEKVAVDAISHFNTGVGAATVPVIYMRGNHEIRGAFSMLFTTLFDYTGGQSYGAMNWGDTRFVMLDCGEDKPDEHPVYYDFNDFSGFRKDQLAFMKKEHKSKEFKKASKRILMHHIPLWGEDMKKEYAPCLELWGEELSKQPYNISINAHTHRAVLYDKGSIGNPFPVAIGGGYNPKGATVMHLSKRGNAATLTCYNTNGEVVFKINI